MESKLTMDIRRHFKLLNIEDTYSNIMTVLYNITEEIKDMYDNDDSKGFYELYRLIEQLFKIEPERHFTTD